MHLISVFLAISASTALAMLATVWLKSNLELKSICWFKSNLELKSICCFKSILELKSICSFKSTLELKSICWIKSNLGLLLLILFVAIVFDFGSRWPSLQEVASAMLALASLELSSPMFVLASSAMIGVASPKGL